MKELRVFLLVKVTQIIVFFCASEEFAFLPPERCDESKKRNTANTCYHAIKIATLNHFIVCNTMKALINNKECIEIEFLLYLYNTSLQGSFVNYQRTPGLLVT